ncbi:MAG: VWA domain-containing protein [Ruminococcus sp.]|nr:VWA domain-containing protein [Ruminococcus sp.]
MTDEQNRMLSVNRWRLVLGGQSAQSLDFSGSEQQISALGEMEFLLDSLYGKANGDDVREEDSSGRGGGSGASRLSAAEWIARVRDFFPKQTADVLERHALDEFHLTELLTDKEVLEKAEPSFDLLRSVLSLRHLMKGEVVETAKRLAAKVAEELRKKIEDKVIRSYFGRLERTSSRPMRISRNIDMKKTVRRNLKNYDPDTRQLVLKEVWFTERVKRYCNKTVILAVDESGSMMDSVIYSAVMAQIISKLPLTKIHLVVFDTSVLDLTGCVEDPAEVLMSVQLGGGTNISKALTYCERLVSDPARTAVICVTDLYEGGSLKNLYRVSRRLIDCGVSLSFLTALDMKCAAVFDHSVGQELADMGAFVGAMTPDLLGEHIGRIFSGA